jgi:hypothetical protein
VLRCFPKSTLANCPHFLENAVVSSRRLPETIAHVRITNQSWLHGRIEGEVRANEYEWQFQWCFRQGLLVVEPSLGRALIKEPLSRFLESCDYQLEPGGDYSFKIRAAI